MVFKKKPKDVSTHNSQVLDEEDRKPLSTALKDEILLISFLVLFVGIISTDTYYATFGVRYQFLSLPSFHILYRGLTILIYAPYLLIPYGVLVIYLWFDRDILRRGNTRVFSRWRNPLSYALMFIMLAVTYPMARYAGVREAEIDMHEGSTTLPEVVHLDIEGKTLEVEEALSSDSHYRLLLIDSDYLIVFRPLKAGALGVLPNIKRISKGDVHVIETNR